MSVKMFLYDDRSRTNYFCTYQLLSNSNLLKGNLLRMNDNMVSVHNVAISYFYFYHLLILSNRSTESLANNVRDNKLKLPSLQIVEKKLPLLLFQHWLMVNLYL